MTAKELLLILQEGEGYKIEFKENVSNLDKDIVAFANSSGGRIFIGISDDRKIKGVVISNKLKSQIQDIANNCRPKVKILFDKFKNILIVDIREGDDKPYECSGGFYKRIGSISQKMSRDEIIDFFKSEGKVRFDELIDPKFSYPKDFDKTKLIKFLQFAGITRITQVETILTNLGVAEKQEGKLYLNNAGVLLFARNPQKFIPWSVFTVALFKDKQGVDVIDRKEINGSLFEIVEQVMAFIKLYAKVAYRFIGKPQREEIYEYPNDAIREAVINSVIHKYYFERGHNNILKFLPHQIQIENYWQKPRNFILGKTIFRRNHLIVDLFARIHFGEKMGTGFKRIREICRKGNAPFPNIEFNDNYFYVTFKPSYEYLNLAKQQRVTKKVTERWSEKWSEKWSEAGLTKRQIALLLILKENPKITRKTLSKKLKINPSAVQKHIAKLKQKGILRRIGPDKGGYWQIIETCLRAKTHRQK
jgi:ATP-dependent DNA helicase RecG